MCSLCKMDEAELKKVRQRQGAVEPEDFYKETDYTPRKKKNTKRWCKGKVGKEHEPVIELNTKRMYGNIRECRSGGWWYCFHHEVCKNCHKELKYMVDCPDFPGQTKRKWPWS